MKIKDVIAWVDEIKPNAFSSETKLRWLNQLEGTLAADVFLMAPTEARQMQYTPADMDAEMLVEPPYDDIYELWLAAKIDETNGEYNKYQNTMQSYNARRSAFVSWFCQLYDPVQGYRRGNTRDV